MSTTQDQTLDDELFAVDMHTVGKDTARAKIVDEPDTTDHSITIRLRVLTTGDEFEVTYQKPRTWDGSNEFVRLVEHLGYSSASATEIEGEELRVRYVEGDWQIDDGEFDYLLFFDKQSYFRGVSRTLLGTLIFLGATLFATVTSTYVTIGPIPDAGRWVWIAVFAFVGFVICGALIRQGAKAGKPDSA